MQKKCKKIDPKHTPVQFGSSEERMNFPYEKPSDKQVFYKFQSPSLLSLYTLTEKYFWFSFIAELNDPHEQKLSWQDYASDEEIIMWAEKIAKKGEFHLIGGKDISYILNNTDNAIDKLRDWWLGSLNLNIEMQKSNKRKVFCASEQCSSPAMWAHYSYNHTGWAIGFKPNSIFDEAPEECWFKVRYQDKYPEFGLADMFENMEWQYKLFSTKSEEWRYEREWRCSHENESHKISINTDFVECIIFGKDCCEQTERLVVTLTKDWRINYFKARPSLKGYEILYDPVSI